MLGFKFIRNQELHQIILQQCADEFANLQDEKVKVKLVQYVVQNFLKQTSSALIEQYRQTF